MSRAAFSRVSHLRQKSDIVSFGSRQTLGNDIPKKPNPDKALGLGAKYTCNTNFLTVIFSSNFLIHFCERPKIALESKVSHQIPIHMGHQFYKFPIYYRPSCIVCTRRETEGNTSSRFILGAISISAIQHPQKRTSRCKHFFLLPAITLVSDKIRFPLLKTLDKNPNILDSSKIDEW